MSVVIGVLTVGYFKDVAIKYDFQKRDLMRFIIRY